MDFLTGLGLSSAAGVNAYIPLLVMGLLARFTDLVALPDTASWLASTPALVVIAVLLIVEVVADKIPALDTVNDVIHTLVRPASGGIAFSSAMSATTPIVTPDSAGFSWKGLIVGAAIALGFHLMKMTTRPAANVVTVGTAAPVLSVVEDVFALVSSLFALLLPFLVIILIAGFLAIAYVLVRRAKRTRRARRAATHAHMGPVVDLVEPEALPPADPLLSSDSRRLQ